MLLLHGKRESESTHHAASSTSPKSDSSTTQIRFLESPKIRSFATFIVVTMLICNVNILYDVSLFSFPFPVLSLLATVNFLPTFL
ncbi:hypothetical protein CJ030_MR7G022008 [Morella rubra]|uniref:Transmembrane protein n=1 Tax=Morella rubra TaxID=262757 RepID=A0A6A1UXI8_9ROSI|nr:hypothetical protein CJ030_MR7G022008 [Morella rubra]